MQLIILNVVIIVSLILKHHNNNIFLRFNILHMLNYCFIKIIFKDLIKSFEYFKNK